MIDTVLIFFGKRTCSCVGEFQMECLVVSYTCVPLNEGLILVSEEKDFMRDNVAMTKAARHGPRCVCARRNQYSSQVYLNFVNFYFYRRKSNDLN